MVFSTKDSILGLATGTYTKVTSSGIGTRVLGRYVAPVVVSGTISAVVVPVTGKELQRLPEGYRSDDFKTVYTTSLLVAHEEDESIGDIILVDSDRYQVQHLDIWDDPFDGNRFYAALVKRKELE